MGFIDYRLTADVEAEDTSCHHGPGEVCVFCIKNSDVATAAVNDLSDKYGVPRDLGQQIAADMLAAPPAPEDG